MLDDLNNDVVWIVSTRPLISNSSSTCTIPLVTVPCESFTRGITVAFMFHSFYSSLAKSRYLFFFSFNFSFTKWWAETAKSSTRRVLSFFFFFTITRSGSPVEIRWSAYTSKSQKSLCVSFFRTDSGLCKYHLFMWLNFNFLHNSHWITFPTQSCLVLYSYCANLRHLFII